MHDRAKELTAHFFGSEWDQLSAAERRVLERVLDRTRLSHDTNLEFAEQRTMGDRLADRIAAFGGSWTFILLFLALLNVWIVVNVTLARRHGPVFDPYPFILLNLVLSMLAALQAPVIMLSQNRQAAKDRLDAAHDYEVNLKAEIEIRTLHDKIDALRESDWATLVGMQQEQLRLLERLLAASAGNSARQG
jgi:uncharacterized membrane protein